MARQKLPAWQGPDPTVLLGQVFSALNNRYKSTMFPPPGYRRVVAVANILLEEGLEGLQLVRFHCTLTHNTPDDTLLRSGNHFALEANKCLWDETGPIDGEVASRKACEDLFSSGQVSGGTIRHSTLRGATAAVGISALDPQDHEWLRRTLRSLIANDHAQTLKTATPASGNPRLSPRL